MPGGHLRSAQVPRLPGVPEARGCGGKEGGVGPAVAGGAALHGTWRWAPCVRGRGIRLTAWSPGAPRQDARRRAGSTVRRPCLPPGRGAGMSRPLLAAGGHSPVGSWLGRRGLQALLESTTFPEVFLLLCGCCVGLFSPLPGDSLSLHQNSLIPVDSWWAHLVQGLNSGSSGLCPGAT